MKTIKLCFFVAVLVVFSKSGLAQRQVSMAEARNVAMNVLRTFDKKMNTRMLEVDTIDVVNTLDRNGNTLLYEVCFTSKSRVLLSGHRGCIPVLGIITSMNDNVESVFSISEELPGAFIDFINEYARQIELCFDINAEETYRTSWNSLQQNDTNNRSENSIIIPAMLSTKWGQSRSNDSGDYNAYNAYSPSGTYCSKCYAGCSAVAMAQIVKYWVYPQEMPYNCTNYYFNLMPDELIRLGNTNYESQKDTVAKFIHDCGVAMNMDYCSNHSATAAPESCSSSTYYLSQILKAFKSFGYSDVIDEYESSCSSHVEWVNKVSLELFYGHPVLYAASRYDSIHNKIIGHAFVCDGYIRDDSNNQVFHINWGWNGSPDTWFALDNLNPSVTYNLNHQGIFGIYPTDCWENIIMECDKTFSSGTVKFYATSDKFWNNYHDYVINSGANVLLQAGKEIYLTDGFCAEAGSEFTAYLASCGNSADDMETRETDALKVTNESLLRMESTNQNLFSVSHMDMSIYPNPVTGTFNIRLGNPYEMVRKMEVSTMQGGVVYSKDNVTNEGIDVSAIPHGMYVVRVIGSMGNVYFGKFVKE